MLAQYLLALQQLRFELGAAPQLGGAPCALAFKGSAPAEVSSYTAATRRVLACVPGLVVERKAKARLAHHAQEGPRIGAFAAGLSHYSPVRRP